MFEKMDLVACDIVTKRMRCAELVHEGARRYLIFAQTAQKPQHSSHFICVAEG